MINQKGESVSTEFWGVEIEFERGEKVIIDSAEVEAVVTDIQVNTCPDDCEHQLLYGVEFPYGSVWTQDCGYDADTKWVGPSDIRKIKPKKSFLERFFEEHKLWYETTDLVNRQIESYSKLGNAK
jgi:hypothetical protein